MRDPIPATLLVVDRTLDLATPCMHKGGALFARCLSVLSPYGSACNGTTFSVPVAPNSMPTFALSGTQCHATAAMPSVAAESGEGGGITAGAAGAGAGAGAGVSHTETGPGETGAGTSGVEDAAGPIMKEGAPSLCVETDTGVTEALLEGLFSGRGVGPSLVHAHTSSVSGLHDLVVDVLTAPRPTVLGESPALTAAWPCSPIMCVLHRAANVEHLLCALLSSVGHSKPPSEGSVADGPQDARGARIVALWRTMNEEYPQLYDRYATVPALCHAPALTLVRCCAVTPRSWLRWRQLSRRKQCSLRGVPSRSCGRRCLKWRNCSARCVHFCFGVRVAGAHLQHRGSS